MNSSPEDDDGGGVDSECFDRERHVMFLEMMYELLPSGYESQEINRLTLAYFVISGLDLLGALDRVDKDKVIDWVLSFQTRSQSDIELNSGQFYGFHGSRTSQFTVNQNEQMPTKMCNGSHLASTYSAVAILKILGYNLSDLNSDTIVLSMKNLQQPDGSFMPTHIGAEKDLRFVYCAAAICSMLNNWEGINKEKAKEFICKCQCYDGGFGLVPGSESHGGASYCAVAALHLMGFIEGISGSRPIATVIDVPLLLEWALQRQVAGGGFQGRTNKNSDTCYAFWIGGVLKMLGAFDFIDKVALRGFLLSCQSQYGGFTKFPDDLLPDLYHSYFGFSAFSMLEEPGLKPLCVELGTSNPAANIYIQM